MMYSVFCTWMPATADQGTILHVTKLPAPPFGPRLTVALVAARLMRRPALVIFSHA